MSDIILKSTNISKQYRLGLVGTGTISNDLNRWWSKVRGKEDPFLKSILDVIKEKEKPHIDDLSHQFGRNKIIPALLELELKGSVQVVAGSCYEINW